MGTSQTMACFRRFKSMRPFLYHALELRYLRQLAWQLAITPCTVLSDASAVARWGGHLVFSTCRIRGRAKSVCQNLKVVSASAHLCPPGKSRKQTMCTWKCSLIFWLLWPPPPQRLCIRNPNQKRRVHFNVTQWGVLLEPCTLQGGRGMEHWWGW